MTDTLLVERPHAGVLLVTLNRPQRLNAINDAMRRELTGTLASAADDVNAVVLKGAGRGFCSGIDMRDFGPGAPAADAPAIDRLRFQESMAALPQVIRDLPQPVIAAVNGPCVGSGLALCLASDIRICSCTATFGNAAILLQPIANADATRRRVEAGFVVGEEAAGPLSGGLAGSAWLGVW